MGRPKGALNKTTRAVKEALVDAFEDLGGVESLVAWAQADPGEFYKLWVKVMPTQIEASGPEGGPIQITWLNPAD